MKLSGRIYLLATGHGLNDLIARYFLGTIVKSPVDITQAAIGLIVYNVIAFGGQYPAALLLERIASPKNFLMIAWSLNVMAVVLFPVTPQLSIVLTGIASALYHVTGGSICAKANKAFNIGLFAAPGVAGLIAGGYFAYSGIAIEKRLLLASIIFLVVLFRIPFGKSSPINLSKKINETTKHSVLDGHDIIMILLLTIISLRSVIWNVFQLVHENDYHWLIAIAASAVIGKVAGGWIADRVGWRLYMILSVLIATPLLTVLKKEMWLFCIGIGLLQSGIPATTALLIQTMRGNTERAIGLSFGLSIIAGALIFYTPARAFLVSDIAIYLIAATILVLIFGIIRRQSKSPAPISGIKLA